MEEDILNYLPTVMFRGTPCIWGKKWQLSNTCRTEINEFEQDRLNTYNPQLKSWTTDSKLNIHEDMNRSFSIWIGGVGVQWPLQFIKFDQRTYRETLIWSDSRLCTMYNVQCTMYNVQCTRNFKIPSILVEWHFRLTLDTVISIDKERLRIRRHFSSWKICINVQRC